jgi:hypothetical protein
MVQSTTNFILKTHFDVIYNFPSNHSIISHIWFLLIDSNF